MRQQGDGELGDGTTTNHQTPEQAGGGGAMAGMTLDATGAWQNLAAFTTAKPQVTNYAYDRLYQLTSVRAPGQETSYTYDPVGNRLSVTSGGTATNLSYDKADRLGGDYVTDLNGNLHQGPLGQFQYDAANRLTQAQTGQGQGVGYTYDGDGNQVGRNPVQISGYQYNVTDVNDVNGGLAARLEETQTGQGPGGPYNASWKFVRGPAGMAYAVDQSNAVTVYHPDGLGSVRAITDGSGTVVQTERVDAFGVVTSSQGGGLQPFGYTGQPSDPESGLSYLHARYYAPTLGRFLQRDPLAESPAAPLSLNRYSYVGNNPTSATDPSGLLTYFIGGIGGSQYPAFVQGLQTILQDVQPQVCAFESCSSRGGTSPNLGGNLPLELARAVFAAGNPLVDSDAQHLASQVKRDSSRFQLSGEQLNLIGYSGGATVAFDAAVILQRYGISINNIVTLGGFVLRGKPGNVGTWTKIIGDADPIASLSGAAVPDAFYEESGVTHIPNFPVPGLPSYLTGNGLVQSLNDIQQAGLR